MFFLGDWGITMKYFKKTFDPSEHAKKSMYVDHVDSG